jgi:hypothetical protein
VNGEDKHLLPVLRIHFACSCFKRANQSMFPFRSDEGVLKQYTSVIHNVYTIIVGSSEDYLLISCHKTNSIYSVLYVTRLKALYHCCVSAIGMMVSTSRN